MSYWLISVPNQGRTEKVIVSELDAATRGLSKNLPFRVPQLKVGTLDSLMSLSDDLAKQDAVVGQIAKKIEKTWVDLQKTDSEDKKDAAAADGSKKKKEESKQQQAEQEQLKIGSGTARDFVEKFSWNETRYPKRSPLRTLTELIVKDGAKADEAIKKQLAEYNEVRSSYAAIDRKDTGSLLVKGLGGLVKEKDLIEKGHLTTLLVAVPRLRAQEFETQYETMEEQQRQKDEAERERREREAKTKQEEAMQREKEREEHRAKQAHDHDEEEEKDSEEREEIKRKAEEEKTQQESERKAREEKEALKNKRLPCPVVVPRSAKRIVDDEKDEFVLYRIVVLRDGAEYIKNICREKRFTVRPYKHDPAEEKAEKDRKAELAAKKQALWQYLLRWCSTTYADVFSGWIHLKAIRLYVESVLRYGLPVSFTAVLMEPLRQRESKLRAELKQLYGKLAGGNVNLAAAENEPDISGLTSGEFYPYVYLPLNLLD